MPAKGQGKKQKGDKFGKLFGGARGAGYDSDEAAAMAYKKVYGQESLEPGAKRMRESLERFGRKLSRRKQ